MTFAVVIPARGGSKGIPHKNVRPFCGVPLIALAVRQVLGATPQVYVTTEDFQIAEIARGEGATVLNRPRSLATDTALGVDVMVDAFQRIIEDVVVWHEGTAPLTYSEDLIEAAELLGPGIDCVVSVSPTDDMLLTLDPFAGVGHDPFGCGTNRQERPQTYRYSGMAWVYPRKAFLQARRGIFGQVVPHITPHERYVDLDNPHDWVMGEALGKALGEWIVVGSSPGGQYAQRLAGRLPWAMTITTNAAYRWLSSNPHVYFLSDSLGCELHGNDAAMMQVSGTRLVTLRRAQAALHSRGVDRFDEFLPLNGPGENPRFVPGEYAQCALSGLFCLQYALNHGARRIHLIGMEGYTDPGKGTRMLETYCGPFTQSCVDACPSVQFVTYGHLNYPLHGDNVRQGALECQPVMTEA